MAIAYSSLGHLSDQGLCVTQHEKLHVAVAMELVLEPLADQPVSAAGTLNDCAARGGFTAHEQRDADDAIIAYGCDFCRRAVLQHIQERYDGVGRKIDVPKAIAGLI